MATIRAKYDTTWTDITPSGLNGLANGSSVTTSALDNNTNQAIDYEFEFSYKYATAPTANNLLKITIEFSSDGTNWTDVDNQEDNIVLTSDTNQHRKRFSINQIIAGSGISPSYFRIRITNNGGQSLASTGNYIKYRKVFLEII